MNQMNHFVDFHIDEEYEFLNTILAGGHVPGNASFLYLGIYGVDETGKVNKEEEIDMKFLDEI
jgi:hypothetical protein